VTVQFHDLAEKRILVTGASSGIGRACALQLSEQGAKLVLVARNEERLTQTYNSLQGTGHLIIAYDFLKHDNYDDLFNIILQNGEKLSGLIHCAGISNLLPLRMMSYEKLVLEMRLNYFAFIELVRQYAKPKNNFGGSIVAISSIASDNPEKGQTNYAASKSALDTSITGLAIELAEKEIRINSVLPGATRTAMMDTSLAADMDEIISKQLLGLVEPKDVANACIFLLSEVSRKTTGRKLFVDGGRLR
jgi:NAD(P)-dependent dehydrogenase (short-subunit alcohol dehydrogenase family)